ncbi:hypothetical protein [Nocardioides gilvus]|uniref:hypothetical protein n=1 Tax=Nocardioides gilvus TaxID=1735589 RepID=UPI000D75024D|nr:hypothetical protein [Nocardioides gilvus]
MQKSRKVLAALATPVAVLAAGALVYQASYAAFTGTTNNTGNEWSTGSINLTDDDNGVAMFRVSNLLPNDTATRCIEVTANASVPSTVLGYTVSPDITNAKGLQDRIKITIQAGNGGSFSTCTGFTAVGAPTVTAAPLSYLMANVNNWDTAAGEWAVAGGAGAEKRTYQITYSFDTAGMTQQQIDGLQGAKVGVGLQWEMRTNE